MVKLKEKKIETFDLRVDVKNDDIQNGECRNPHRCMEKLAIYRGLVEELGENKVDNLRLDGAQIKFNYGGYRWYATTPKKAKINLINFDAKKPVHPHSYTVTFTKGTKIVKHSAERKKQIDEARKARIAAGTPDKRSKEASLRDRVIGLGAV